ncbi:uncharacterized protein LOC124814686 [Hydra vulgaris]|uniref:Uncharacterized protein LOC124814686 n=1 Tax=Hydra vulgaris TaxID=6087 RepID=A0ABM4DP49_HYDVU
MQILCGLLMALCIFKVHSLPILDVELARFFSLNKDFFIVRYMDIPTNFETTFLDCSVPGAETYQWEIVAKSGSPYAGSVQVGRPQNQDVFKPWVLGLTDYEYSWDSLLVKCKAMINNRAIVTLTWIIMKLKSSTEAPYHPTLCSSKKANCFSKMYNCMNEKGITYRGTTNHAQSGLLCLPWNVDLMVKKIYNPILKVDQDMLALFRFPRLDLNALNNLKGEAIGNHNYCRNNNNGNAPSCYNSNGILEYCSIPPCYDCMFGRGGGYYPEKVEAPIYYGKTNITAIEITNDKGERVLQECYIGESSWWSQNRCSLYSNVNGRQQNHVEPSCLIVNANRKLPYPENPFWEGFSWARCITTQCTVRQVWFALVDLDGFIHLDENNKDFIEIPFEIGKNRDIYFYHFGTTFCSSFTLIGYGSTIEFVPLITIVCKNSPEKSSLQIKNPIKEFSGRYTLQYIFTEGNPLLELITFSLNFELVVQTSITIVLNEIFYCPGYSTFVDANVFGTNNINPDLIQWLFTNNNITWYDVITMPESFFVSATGLTIKISKITKVTSLKVKATVSSGDIESIQNIKFLDTPYLYQDTNTIEGTIGKDITLKVKHRPNSVIRWLFGYRLLEKNNIYSFSKFTIDSQFSMTLLKIVNLDKSVEGIYSAEATENKCSSSVSFYLTVTS